MATITLNEPITTKSVESLNVPYQVGWVHAVFYFVSGLWPIVSMNTFTRVVGDQGSTELTQTIGLMMVATSIGLYLALKRRELTTPIIAVAMVNALFLAGFDFYYLTSGNFTVIHLADLVAQAGLFVSWLVAMLPGRRGEP